MTDSASISSDHSSTLSTNTTTTTGTEGTAAPTGEGKPTSQPAMATSSHGHGEVLSRPTPIDTPEANHHEDPSSSTTRPPKKRARSIDTEGANHPHIEYLSLYTPDTAKSSIGDGPRDLICLCTKAPKVPRPRNAFILYRQHYQATVAAQHPGLANPDISKLIGVKWREQPQEVKSSWKQLAEEEKVRHQRQYPDYRYQPRRGGKNASGRPVSANGENPDRCPKCGGRYIATPRTPSTPFTVVTPKLPKPASAMPPYISPNPRVIETDHLRRGSTASTMSVDAHGRRYTQPHLRDIDKNYQMMSPAAAPGPKRRRFGDPPAFNPGSPPMGYVQVDPRFQRPPSMSGPPVSATGYGPGPLPRPGGQYRQPSYPNHPNQANHPHTQPPPRQSMSYQSVPTPNRPNAAFDESLRLPPLQTPLPNSPDMNPDAGAARAMSAAGPPTQGIGLGIIHGGTGPPRQQQQPMPQRWPFLLKLDVLRSISPPLKPPGPGGPIFETRGPIIAIEGAAASILNEIAAVVEQALSVSGEYAVKMWADEHNTAHPVPEVGNGGTSNGNANGKLPENNKTQQKKTVLASPIANYVARMLRWHKTSEDLVRYITSHPRPSPESSGNEPAGDGIPSSKPSTPPKLPVAVVSDGYSLTFSDRYANSLHVNDAYRPDDHWQWVATLWRGIVGADLTIYVKKAAETEVQGNNYVEFANPAVLVLRMTEGRGLDEKLERRLGFEIIEWVRNGSFKAGFARRP